jgi:hypothetical protein
LYECQVKAQVGQIGLAGDATASRRKGFGRGRGHVGAATSLDFFHRTTMSSNSTWDVDSPKGAPQRPASVYPLDWLARTFTSPTRTGELLRPELENGTITPADYRLAQAFLPGTFPLMKVRQITCYFPVILKKLGYLWHHWRNHRRSLWLYTEATMESNKDGSRDRIW